MKNKAYQLCKSSLAMLLILLGLLLVSCAKQPSIASIDEETVVEAPNQEQAELEEEDEDSAEFESAYLNNLGRSPILSPYGKRKSGRRSRMHNGVDIKGPKGAEVLSFKEGEVTFSGRMRGYGLNVDVRHSDGTTTRYAHLSKIRASKGEKLRKGQVLGEVGRTGRASTAHLHFEVIKGGKAVNPMRYFSDVNQLINYNTPKVNRVASRGNKK